MEEALLQIKQLKKYYPWKKKTLKALDGVDFKIHSGELVSVVGESGCGKSTLARCIIHLEQATEGKILFEGNEITSLPRKQMRPFYREMQMVFQNPYAAFKPETDDLPCIDRSRKILWDAHKGYYFQN